MIFRKAAKKNLEIEQVEIITIFLHFFITNRLLIYVKQLISHETLEDLVHLLF